MRVHFSQFWSLVVSHLHWEVTHSGFYLNLPAICIFYYCTDMYSAICNYCSSECPRAKKVAAQDCTHLINYFINITQDLISIITTNCHLIFAT